MCAAETECQVRDTRGRDAILRHNAKRTWPCTLSLASSNAKPKASGGHRTARTGRSRHKVDVLCSPALTACRGRRYGRIDRIGPSRSDGTRAVSDRDGLVRRVGLVRDRADLVLILGSGFSRRSASLFEPGRCRPVQSGRRGSG